MELDLASSSGPTRLTFWSYITSEHPCMSARGAPHRAGHPRVPDWRGSCSQPASPLIAFRSHLMLFLILPFQIAPKIRMLAHFSVTDIEAQRGEVSFQSRHTEHRVGEPELGPGNAPPPIHPSKGTPGCCYWGCSALHLCWSSEGWSEAAETLG